MISKCIERCQKLLFTYIYHRYGAKVVNVRAKLDPKIAEEKAKYMETIKQETTETAIETVKKKLKDAQEAAAEAARIEAGKFCHE